MLVELIDVEYYRKKCTVTFRRFVGSAEVLPTRPGVDPLEVTRPLEDFSWTTQSPIAASPSVIARPGTQPPAGSYVFGPLTTQVGPGNPPREDPTSLHCSVFSSVIIYKDGFNASQQVYCAAYNEIKTTHLLTVKKCKKTDYGDV